jgi:glycoprotein endo-alpha-1,2-mannosidase
MTHRKQSSALHHTVYVSMVLLFFALSITCKQSAESKKENSAKIDSFNVGVYYYPWYSSDFHGGHYMRELLIPPQYPELGEYNDRNAGVIAQHLSWSREYGIDFWVTSWWGPGGREDVTTLNFILRHPDLGQTKIALFYETPGRTDGYTNFTVIRPDIAYMAQNYFAHPNYLRIDNKPVLFIYLTRDLAARGFLEDVISTMRNTALAADFELFIVGDHAFGSAPSSAGNIALLDAITNYDVYGSMGARGYATQASVDSYIRQQERWKQVAQSVDVSFVPAVSPGFNDTGVRDGHPPLSRKLTAEDEFGSLFRAMLFQAREQVDTDLGNMFVITSWNEWHEDTQIEPVAIADSTNRDNSATGSAYTNGLYYEGYGDRYLQILREETSE